VWDNGLFPYRIPIEFSIAIMQERRITLTGEILDTLTSVWGRRYGWALVNKQPLEGKAAETIYEIVDDLPNELSAIERRLEILIAEAKLRRDIERRERRKVIEQRYRQMVSKRR
jgi:hypothetical protein